MFTYWLIGMALEIQWVTRYTVKQAQAQANEGWKPTIDYIIVALLLTAFKAGMWPLNLIQHCYTIIKLEDENYYKFTKL